MTTLGRYRLERRLGGAGEIEIYEATLLAAQGVERRVALKKLMPGAGPELVASFIDEARLASRLHHANIVAVLDFGEIDGVYFQARELIEGADLESVLTQAAAHGPSFSETMALFVAAQVGRALDYAHRAVGPDAQPLGLVHRDVSPRNILIGREGEVKLADFGNAWALERSARTAVGIAKGTLGYMSPEQARGEEVGPSADIFALGCVLHRALCGRSPVEGATLQALAAGVAPAIDVGLAPDLKAIVARATEVRSQARHRDARELADACEAALAVRSGWRAQGELAQRLAALTGETSAPDRPRTQVLGDDSEPEADPTHPLTAATAAPLAPTRVVTPAPTPSQIASAPARDTLFLVGALAVAVFALSFTFFATGPEPPLRTEAEPVPAPSSEAPRITTRAPVAEPSPPEVVGEPEPARAGAPRRTQPAVTSANLIRRAPTEDRSDRIGAELARFGVRYAEIGVSPALQAAVARCKAERDDPAAWRELSVQLEAHAGSRAQAEARLKLFSLALMEVSKKKPGSVDALEAEYFALRRSLQAASGAEDVQNVLLELSDLERRLESGPR